MRLEIAARVFQGRHAFHTSLLRMQAASGILGMVGRRQPGASSTIVVRQEMVRREGVHDSSGEDPLSAAGGVSYPRIVENMAET